MALIQNFQNHTDGFLVLGVVSKLLVFIGVSFSLYQILARVDVCSGSTTQMLFLFINIAGAVLAEGAEMSSELESGADLRHLHNLFVFNPVEVKVGLRRSVGFVSDQVTGSFPDHQKVG